MADFRWAQGSIAGTSLQVSGDPTKCYILDGANVLQGKRYVNSRVSASGLLYQQGFDTEGRNARFGVRIANLPKDKFDSIVSSVAAAVDAGAAFRVTLQDDWQTIDADCFVDGSDWLKYDDGVDTNSQFVSGVVMRFVTR